MATTRQVSRPSSLVDTRVIYCGDNLEQLARLPDACVDLIYIDPPFNSNRNYEVFWGETKEKRAFEDRHASTQAYIEYMRPRCVELVRVLKATGSFYYHCDWHASHYVDGRIYPVAAAPKKLGKATGHLDFMDDWYPVQVKQKDKAGRPDIDSFEAMMTRNDRKKGFFVSFDYPGDAIAEVGAFFRKSGRVIVPLTVREILDEQIAHKLA